MILYHGSNVIVKQPKIIVQDKGRDFGPAFYVTPIKEQAERMAKRKQKQKIIAGEKIAKAVVSVFDWDEDVSRFNYKEYKDADLNWLNMVIKCRSKVSFKHDYDIVKGKIADDNVGETILFVVRGVMRKEDAIKRLRFQKINSQIAFCTDESLKTLKFVKSYEVK